MESWTDDDGVTHDMSGIMARCFVDVRSRRGVCVNDLPPRPITCLRCLGPNLIERVLQDMAQHGMRVDYDKLEEARKLCSTEEDPLGS